MFTGIVEEIGRVVSLTRSPSVSLWDGTTGEGWVLVISASVVLGGAYEGCSIAVNGTCLTVTAFDATSFTVGCAPETMRRTNLLDLAAASPVNLERAAAGDARNSGHAVQGHVDDTGAILATWREGDSLWVRVGARPAVLRYIVEKGYVAVDGTSLTVCDVDVAGGSFTFMLVAYTQSRVIIAGKAVGDRVNLEVDVVGKLVERSAAGLVAAVTRVEERLESALAALGARLDKIEARLEAARL
jgi:riboflavin synthase